MFIVGNSAAEPKLFLKNMSQWRFFFILAFDVFIDDLDECAAELDLIIKFADDTKGLK